MKAEFWALCTAVCWAVGSLFEKKGVKLGNLTPAMGTAVRTAVSLLLLPAISWPYWGEVKKAGLKSLLMIALGGGLLSGVLGVICLYSGLKNGHLSTVLTIAFCMTPVLGVILGIVFMKEQLAVAQYIGIFLCIVGAALTVYFK
ncbi:MAG: EamA family transporter [Victivallales bacterium]|nr:EamA family transporter [Victivallales bacterium]